MGKVTSEKKDAILGINWEALEIFWADIYEEDYVTNIASNYMNPSFENVHI